MIRTFIKRIGRWSSVIAESPTEPEIDRYPVRSTSILALGHDPARRCLQVEYFNGTLYRVDDVPRDIYQALIGADDFDEFYRSEIGDKRTLKKIGSVYPIYG